MKKHILSLYVVFIMFITNFPLISINSAETIEIDLFRCNITDEQLALMVVNGAIPKNITTLRLGMNQITDITPLNELLDLRKLILSDNQIHDLTPLNKLTNLEDLSLGKNQITDLTPLSDLTNLQVLSLSDNRITDISPLEKLTSLKFLSLSRNSISDVTILAKFTDLEDLFLDNVGVSDISFLSGLINIRGPFGRLVLSNNRITDLSPLKNLTELQWLGLENNQITDISPLSGLGNLSGLYLQNNQISDLSPLEWLIGLSPRNTASLNLAGNPVSLAQIEQLHEKVRGNRQRGVLTLGHVLGTEEYTIHDALEILKYLADLENNIIGNCSVALMAALIVSENEPGIGDALEILKKLAGVPSLVD